MRCPECGKPSDVIDSRIRKDGKVTRRRRCFNDHRFSTLESAHPSPELAAAVKLISEAMK